MAAGEHGQRGGGQPSGVRQPVTPPPGGGAADEARAQRERMQGADGQPQQQGASDRSLEQQRKNLKTETGGTQPGGPTGPQGRPGTHAQPPPPPQHGGAPPKAERGQPQGQPEGGKRKPEKGTPPPGPR